MGGAGKGCYWLQLGKLLSRHSFHTHMHTTYTHSKQAVKVLGVKVQRVNEANTRTHSYFFCGAEHGWLRSYTPATAVGGEMYLVLALYVPVPSFWSSVVEKRRMFYTFSKHSDATSETLHCIVINLFRSILCYQQQATPPRHYGRIQTFSYWEKKKSRFTIILITIINIPSYWYTRKLISPYKKCLFVFFLVLWQFLSPLKFLIPQ